ncbi:hypothetical protein LX36DRAFT_702524 [Colletotrichum falcatum]|nr:hypothetical protein LX36DRAFT_702524 [Colletotrichum falcatum]
MERVDGRSECGVPRRLPDASLYWTSERSEAAIGPVQAVWVSAGTSKKAGNRWRPGKLSKSAPCRCFHDALGLTAVSLGALYRAAHERERENARFESAAIGESNKGLGSAEPSPSCMQQRTSDRGTRDNDGPEAGNTGGQGGLMPNSRTTDDASQKVCAYCGASSKVSRPRRVAKRIRGLIARKLQRSKRHHPIMFPRRALVQRRENASKAWRTRPSPWLVAWSSRLSSCPERHEHGLPPGGGFYQRVGVATGGGTIRVQANSADTGQTGPWWFVGHGTPAPHYYYTTPTGTGSRHLWRTVLFTIMQWQHDDLDGRHGKRPGVFPGSLVRR